MCLIFIGRVFSDLKAEYASRQAIKLRYASRAATLGSELKESIINKDFVEYLTQRYRNFSEYMEKLIDEEKINLD